MIARLILGRCVSALVTLIAISIIVFAMVQMLPGDVASMVLGRFASETAKEALRQQLHLYQPAAWRYLGWLAGLLTGNLGDDLSSQQPIAVIIAPALGNTLVLSGAALAIYLPLTLSVAGVQAFYRYGGIDHGLSTVTMIGASIPEFLMSILFLVMFVVVMPVLPAVSFVDEHTSFIGWLSALALPAVVLAIVMSVYGIRMLRGNLIEILQSDFIQVALLRGLSPGRVLIRHALPNALIPTLNVTALNLGYLIGGVVVVEKVFAFPGFGSLMVDAVSFRDVPLVEATVMIAAAIYVASNLVADLMAIVLNPKLRRTS